MMEGNRDMYLSAEDIAKAFDYPFQYAVGWVQPLNEAMLQFGINMSVTRMIDFLAQIGWESNMLRTLQENLKYSEKGLRTYFKTKFKETEFAKFAYHDVQIGNRVYANIIGNGPEESGDGFRFHGRGLIQLTGRANYMAASLALGIDLVANPDLAADVTVACKIAAWFWFSRGCNELSDKGQFQAITRRINGGLNGYNGRVALRSKIAEVLGS